VERLADGDPEDEEQGGEGDRAEQEAVLPRHAR
jgi:hypothetical protein